MNPNVDARSNASRCAEDGTLQVDKNRVGLRTLPDDLSRLP